MIRNLISVITMASTLALGAVSTAGATGWADFDAPAIVVAQVPRIGRFALRGRITYFHGFGMGMRADGRPVAVSLHQGTVILPTGLSLRPGMFVRVDGHWDRSGTFHANRIVLMH